MIDLACSNLRAAVSHKKCVTPSGCAAELVQNGYRRVSPRALEEAGLNESDARLTAQLINRAYAERQDAIRAYEEQNSKVESDVRELLEQQFGEYVYDSYLYATAQRNRVKLISVAEGSAAQQGGVLAGDLIYSLDGKRVFGPGDIEALQSLHQSAEELVEFRVDREGASLSVYVPRGNLGVRFASVRVNPGSN
jgi:C-terminal processing protease CtpA/Prc